MSKRMGRPCPPPAPHTPVAAEVVQFLSAAVAGALPGLLLGAVFDGSLVLALAGAIAGSHCGMTAAVKQAEGPEG
jgi:hypothetical protein